MSSRGPEPVRAHGPAVSTSPATASDERGGQQPEPPGRRSAWNSRVIPVAPHAEVPPPPPPAPGTTLPVPVAGEPAEAVVAEDQLQDAVVLRAADVRAATRGQSSTRATHQPPADDQRGSGDDQGPEPAAQPPGAASRYTERERRAAPGAPAASWSGRRGRRATPASDDPPCAGRLDRPHQWRTPPAISSSTSSASGLLNRNISDGDRGDRQHRAGDQAGDRPDAPPHRGVQQRRPRPRP